jgi:multidrug efflux pump subunit AcrB
MIKFLIHRPIAVIMTFTAIMVLGLVASGYLPVSLMPNIDIPEITVQVNRSGESAREIDEGIVSPLRYQLMQVPHLDKLSTESRNGAATLRLRFNYGADINYAFIDVNEKVDAAMDNLPDDMDRPAIVKASASDLPVFYVNIWKENTDEIRFMELSQLTQAVIIKRMEQLPQVAMVDITGHAEPELFIKPDEERLTALGITHDDISSAIEENNLTMGSLQVVDGQYIFNIRFSNTLRTIDDVKNIRLNTGKRLFKLEELARIEKRQRNREGAFFANDHAALSLAVIKQSDARMADLKKNVNHLISLLKNDYPDLHFDVVRDQTALLEYSINNLQQNLLFGGILAFLILFFFLKDARSPWLIGISVPVSLVVAFLFFHMAGLSINIISLSGLILGVGMMIDNSIIVIDNITQYIYRGEKLSLACIKGTNEVIRPLISSVLTTCAVFVPLIFLSGISGALFYDQAVAVAIGLTASLFVSITLIPVLYHLFRYRSEKKGKLYNGKMTRLLQRLDVFKSETLYEKGFDHIFKHRKLTIALFIFLLIPAALLFLYLPKERFPQFKQNELLLHIDWNEKLNLDENLRRTALIRATADNLYQISNTYAGTQKYKLHKEIDQSVSEALVYFRCKNNRDLRSLKNKLADTFQNKFQRAIITWKAPSNIFEKLFEEDQPLLLVRVSNSSERGFPDIDEMQKMVGQLNSGLPGTEIAMPASERYMEIHTRPERLALYNIKYSTLFQTLKAALNAWQVGVLHTGSQYVPMVIGNTPHSVDKLLNELKVSNQNNTKIPVKELISIRTKHDYKILNGSSQGSFVPLAVSTNADVPSLIQRMSAMLKTNYDADTQFSGSWFSSRQLIKELIIVLFISLILLYFILAAQFESLVQPLILLLEVPIDIAGALLLLWLFGGTLNLMSMIGLVVMSGIIINDSILKIDTINHLRKDGMPLLNAIREGGHRRLKPIIMTSITTILALVPVLWSGSMGSELQRPLALTVIGGMILGTIVSLYFIPLCYYYLYRKET